MTILVTGGAGFIGANFVRRTLATRPGVEIVVLDALTYAGRLSNLDGLEGQYEFVHGDIRDAALVDSLVARVDGVIHFAAESHNDNSLHSPRPTSSASSPRCRPGRPTDGRPGPFVPRPVDSRS